jgi:phage recombination protein Bet
MNTTDLDSQNGLCNFPPEKIQLLKDTVCKGSSDAELQLFLHVCVKTGLDPFMKQIYSIRRKSKDKNGDWFETQTIQTSIDGLRLIAERTCKYAPGKEPVYVYDSNGRLFSATAFVKKMTADGTWHDVSSTAFNAEFNPGTQFWNKMPHVMLAKVAEASALRKAFPAEMAGIYSDDEMEQAKKPEEKLIEIDPKEKEDKFKKFVENIPEDQKMLVTYLMKYSDHWKKSAEETMEIYRDGGKFSTDFEKWKAKQEKQLKPA